MARELKWALSQKLKTATTAMTRVAMAPKATQSIMYYRFASIPVIITAIVSRVWWKFNVELS